MQPTVEGRIAARDGTQIAYSQHGTAGPAVVMANGYSTSTFYWRELIDQLGGEARLITWDLKGHGRSEPARSLDACRIVDSVDDMRRVMDALEIERAVLVGFSVGCQIVLEAWRQFPERIQAIVPILGTYANPFETLLHPAFGRLFAKVFKNYGYALAPGGFRLTLSFIHTPLAHRLNQLSGMVGPHVSHEKMMPFYEHLGKLDEKTWVAMGIGAMEHSAEDLLPTIAVPVLVVSGGRDTMTPPERAEEMVERIPGCELLSLPAATHTGLFELSDVIGVRLRRFLQRNQIL